MSALEPFFRIEDVTPEKARDFLSRNTHNRNPKRNKINMYARDMANGAWTMTGEAIKFSPDGVMLDGQNRCYAIIKANVPVKLLVGYNIPDMAMNVMDSGATRSASDALTLNGYGNTRSISSAAFIHNAWVNGAYKTAASRPNSDWRMTNSEVLSYVESHPELIEATRRARKIRASGVQISEGSFAAAIVIFSKINADDAEEFFSRLTEYRTDGLGDPINTLLRRLQKDYRDGAKVDPGRGIYYLVRTWNAFRSGKKLNSLRIGNPDTGWCALPDPK